MIPNYHSLLTDNYINMILSLTAFQVVFSFRVHSQPKGFTWKWKAISNYGGVSKSMLTLNEAIIDVKKG
ncbi:hypothetical protein GRJ22_17385 [Photobacterium carnosum]|uniref:hypothetical protein n=1 Tax=Photobacterium carnosum TaxID=2023717 RepID=UPI001E38FEDF|nr:hypothetical protein [Photobacterium carnosum]MCD9465133.1 hypothetical protein [Photobacterium phosphoreum]MCD9539572.1 hypothetical protein [Photobacterium carnosum]MCD9558156.1 hypothetical protein [Photobacterium carnosum]MCF2164012.1 hypothetical protein [Photobacterium carnosum]